MQPETIEEVVSPQVRRGRGEVVHEDAPRPRDLFNANQITGEVVKGIARDMQSFGATLLERMDKMLAEKLKAMTLHSAITAGPATFAPLQVQPRTIRTLRHIYGANARFKSIEQGQIVEAICQRQSHVLGVLPTGGGKTVAMMIPALLWKSSGKKMVVLTPLNPLVEDLAHRFENAGLQTDIWKNASPPRGNSTVIVANFAQLGGHLKNFILEEAAARRLALIAIDECHYAEMEVDWRPELTKLGQMWTFGVPLALLTATLPPTKTRAVLEAFGLSETNTVEIRGRTGRPNIRYAAEKIEKVERHNAEDSLYRYIKRQMKVEMAHGELGIVYINDTKKLDTLKAALLTKDEELDAQIRAEDPHRAFIQNSARSSGLKVVISHAQLSPEENKKAMESWEQVSPQGFTSWVLTTKFLGLGLDKATVKYVIHGECPENMVNFVQESGRAGRAGQEAESSIFWTRTAIVPQVDKGNREDLIKSLENRQCKRLAMESHMDGIGYTCLSQPGNVRLCQICEEDLDFEAQYLRNPSPPPSPGPIIQYTVEQAMAANLGDVDSNL